MAQFDFFTQLPGYELRKIRYTQFISSMLAGINGRTFQNVPTAIYNYELVPPPLIGGMPNGTGVSETMGGYGTTAEGYEDARTIQNLNSQEPTYVRLLLDNDKDSNGNYLLPSNEISLRKRWRQARSLTTHTDVTGELDGHPQANKTFYDVKPSGEDINDSDITHGAIDASDTSNNGVFANGPYKMSDFFGFSAIEVNSTIVGNPFVLLEYEYSLNMADNGFTPGMMMINNTDDGHPDNSSWFYGGKFPTGGYSDTPIPITYAGGEGTNYDNYRSPWYNPNATYPELNGPFYADNSIPLQGGSTIYANNKSQNTLELHLGPGIDYFYIQDFGDYF